MGITFLVCYFKLRNNNIAGTSGQVCKMSQMFFYDSRNRPQKYKMASHAVGRFAALEIDSDEETRKQAQISEQKSNASKNAKKKARKKKKAAADSAATNEVRCKIQYKCRFD